jgi:SMI1-KNR4 cell-wall
MRIEEVIAELRELNQPVQAPLRLPSEDEVTAAERLLDTEFPEDYRRYLLEASDVVFGSLEPAVVVPDAGYLYLVELAQSAWTEIELPRDLLPICEDNGDYYCLNNNGEVCFWSHNGTTDERWPDLATWIKEVWINEE